MIGFFSVRACLVATVRDTGAAQSTVKLVATNLIASGSIWDGVQLLCLIGKGLDACRYLESYGHWGAATWLARAVLSPQDACEVIRKWADHLSSMGHKVSPAVVSRQGLAFSRDKGWCLVKIRAGI